MRFLFASPSICLVLNIVWTCFTTDSPTISQYFWKNAEMNPSGPPALFGPIWKRAFLISSSDTPWFSHLLSLRHQLGLKETASHFLHFQFVLTPKPVSPLKLDNHFPLLLDECGCMEIFGILLFFYLIQFGLLFPVTLFFL